MDAQTESELDAFVLLQTSIEVSHRIEDTQTSPDSSLRIVFMGLGIAKVHQETIPEQLGDMSIIACDDLRTDRLVGTDHVPVVFGIELPKRVVESTKSQNITVSCRRSASGVREVTTGDGGWTEGVSWGEAGCSPVLSDGDGVCVIPATLPVHTRTRFSSSTASFLA